MIGRTMAALSGVALLAACGGGGESGGASGGNAPGFEERAAAAEALADRVGALPLSDDDVVARTSGTATFDGNMVLLAGPESGPDTELLGDVRIVADFDDLALSGNASNFQGTVQGGDVRGYGGTLALSNGAIGLDSNAVAGTFSGTLRGGGTEVEVGRADMEGVFLGDPSVRGLVMVTPDFASSDVLIDGVPVLSLSVLGAERR